MHKSLILADGDDPARDLFGDDDEDDSACDSPWKVVPAQKEGNGQSEADFEENGAHESVHEFLTRVSSKACALRVAQLSMHVGFFGVDLVSNICTYT